MSNKKNNPFIPIWKNKDENWNKIPLSIYKEMYDSAKLRHDEILSQSETITTKSIQILTFLIAMLAWSIATITSIDLNSLYTFILVIGYGYIIFLQVSILLPKRLTLKGTAPRTMLLDEDDLTDDKNTEEDKEKIFYYHQLNRYQKRIEQIKNSNNTRVPKFRQAIIGSFVIFSFTAFLFFKYHNPFTSKSSSSSPVSLGPVK